MPVLIPPALRASLAGLRLRARRGGAADGLGLHASRSRGAGLEFAQYRSYEPGDELRRIDWKLYARSDRYFVREAERDSPLACWLVIDATASMGQADRARADFSKLDAARQFAACVFELALRQGDHFGLIGLSEAAVEFVPEGAGARHRDRCLLGLDRLAAGGQLPDATRLRPLWERLRTGALVIILTDGFDEALSDWALRLAAAGREVILARLLSAEERDFPFKGGLRLRDPESGQVLEIDSAAARAEFLERLGAARLALGRQLAAAGILSVEHCIDRPLQEPLRSLFGAGPLAQDRR